MTSHVVNSAPYLRTSREFPTELPQLTVEITRSYIDIAAAINERIISIFPTTVPAITGENWYLVKNQRQQSFRRVYTFTSTADINIGFKLASIAEPSDAYGDYLSGTSWFGLIWGTSVAIPGQITFYLAVNGASTTSDVIRFVAGAGAPALTRGKIVLQWLSNT